MDTQYGIAVTNKFCLFDEDDDVDPYEILKQEEQKRNEALAKEKTDKTKPNKKTKKSAPQTDNKSKTTEQITQKKEEKITSQSQPRTQQSDRPPRAPRQNRENREPREDRRPRRQDENVPSSNEPRDKPEGGFGGRLENRGGFSGRPRGRGGPRGRGRGGFGGGFGGKREFERHSGSDRTGVKPTEKRDGMGAHNWGTFKDDMEEEASKENEEPKEWNQGEDTENQDPNESTESTEQPPSEGDKTPKQMTLDEWKAMEEKKRVKADFNLRKANEGSDTSQWNKGSEYRKPVNESEDEEDEDEEYEEEEEHKSKNSLPIRITFNDSPRRGGRGGRRPRGGRGPRGTPGRGDRRGNPRDSAPRFDDEADFPSLVKSAA